MKNTDGDHILDLDATEVAARNGSSFPRATLSLIARVRELEAALKAAAHLLHGEDIDPDGTRSDEFIEMANRGTVLVPTP